MKTWKNPTNLYFFKQGCVETPKFPNCPPLTGSSWYLIDTFFFTRSKPYMATSFHTIDPLVQMESQLSTWCFIGGKGGIHNFGMNSINDVQTFAFLKVASIWTRGSSQLQKSGGFVHLSFCSLLYVWEIRRSQGPLSKVLQLDALLEVKGVSIIMVLNKVSFNKIFFLKKVNQVDFKIEKNLVHLD